MRRLIRLLPVLTALAVADPAPSPEAKLEVPPAVPEEFQPIETLADSRREKIEGWVRVEFTVLEDGRVADPRIKAAQPPGVFEQAALAAVARSKFRPATANGKPVRRRVAPTLSFKRKD
jgi:protein TonB